MLPRAHRLTDSSLFGVVVRNGRRCGRATLVVHVMCPATGSGHSSEMGVGPGEGLSTGLGIDAESQHPGRESAPSVTFDAPTKVGFVVSKAVGNSVTRNRVQRRLRHAACHELELPDDQRVLPVRGCTLVVRALPAAAGASYADLARDLRTGLERALSHDAKRRDRRVDAGRQSRGHSS